MSRNAFKKAALATIATSVVWGTVQAQESDSDLREVALRLEERVELLEKERAVREEAIKAESPISFSGLIEVEAAGGEDHEGSDSSDVVLATVELVAEASINEWTRAEVVYLFEEDDTDPGEIDQAILTFGNPVVSPLYLAGGRMYVPFGKFETGMVSDPLTLELGETRESALQVGFETDRLYGSVYGFNGDSQEVGDDEDKIDQFGANLGWVAEGEGYGLDVGLGYISSIADSDGWSAERVESLEEKVAGMTGYIVFDIGGWKLIGEYTAAEDEFVPTDLAFRGSGAQPTAWNLEAGYRFTMMGREASFGVARQETSEAVDLGLPERKTLAVLSLGIMDNAALSLEYAFAEDYSTSDGGTEEDGGTFTVQMAAEF